MFAVSREKVWLIEVEERVWIRYCDAWFNESQNRAMLTSMSAYDMQDLL